MLDINESVDPAFDVDDADELQAINDFDFERVALLLGVMEKQINVAPKATSIFGIAQAEIQVLNDQAKDIARARADKIKAAEQARYEAEQRRVADENEQQQHRLRSENPPLPPSVQPPPQPGMPSPQRRIPLENEVSAEDETDNGDPVRRPVATRENPNPNGTPRRV